MSDLTFDPTTARCDADVYRNGVIVSVIGDHPGSHRLEAWVESVRKASGQRVDWHFFAGRAVVKAIGDLDAVKRAMEHTNP